MTTGKYTLLFSQKAHSNWGANTAITNDGVDVEYTCMVEESVYGNWERNYHWKDALVVGYIDNFDQIKKYRIKSEAFY